MSTNTDIIRAGYDAIAKGDAPTLLGMLDPAVEWTEAEGFPYAGAYTGPDAILSGVIARLGSEWTPFQVKPGEFIDGGDQVVTLGRYAGTYNATGKSFEADFSRTSGRCATARSCASASTSIPRWSRPPCSPDGGGRREAGGGWRVARDPT